MSRMDSIFEGFFVTRRAFKKEGKKVMANDACKRSRRVGTKVESGVEPQYDGRRALVQSCGVPC